MPPGRGILGITRQSLTNPSSRIVDLGVNYPWHDLTVGTVGQVVFFEFGYLGSLLFHPEIPKESEIT